MSTFNVHSGEDGTATQMIVVAVVEPLVGKNRIAFLHWRFRP